MSDTRRSVPLLLGWMLLAGALTALGHGRWNLPLGVWVGTLLFVRSFRCSSGWLAWPLFVVVSAASWELAYIGTVPMPTFPRWMLFGGLSAVLGLTLLLDRRLAAVSDSFLVTLAMPCAWVVYDLLNALFSPTGSWGSIAYAVSESLPMAQLASITGWTGLTFLVAWFASAGNWVWDRGVSAPAARPGLLWLITVFAVVGVGGQARLAWGPSDTETARAALIVGPSTYQGEHQRAVWEHLHVKDAAQSVREDALRQIGKTQDVYWDMTEQELRSGARIVSWAECNVNISEREEADWIERFSALARAHAAYIGMGFFVNRPHSGERPVNKFVMLGPDGGVVWDYIKATRVPGRSHIVGDGILPSAETEFGRMSTGICFDLDFPRLMAQAGRMRADIVLQPADTWPEVKWLHARMARLRAIEQGFMLLRDAREGIAMVTDARGRTLARRDTDALGNGTLVVDAPIRAGIHTVYSRIGDSFAWLCAAGLVLALARAVVRRTPAGVRTVTGAGPGPAHLKEER